MYIVFDTEIYALVLLDIDSFARKNEMKLKKKWKIAEVEGEEDGKRKGLALLRLLFGNLILRSQQKHYHPTTAVVAAAAATLTIGIKKTRCDNVTNVRNASKIPKPPSQKDVYKI